MICRNCKQSVDLLENLRHQDDPHHSDLICPVCGAHNGYGRKPENLKKRKDKNNKWRAMWKDIGFCCVVCGATEEDFPNSGQWQVDHILPLSKNGEDIFENTMMLCTFCHTFKNSEHSRREALKRSLASRGD